MRIILACTGDTSRVAVIFPFDFPTMEHRIKIWRARACLRLSADAELPLHRLLSEENGEANLGLNRAEDVVQQV